MRRAIDRGPTKAQIAAQLSAMSRLYGSPGATVPPPTPQCPKRAKPRDLEHREQSLLFGWAYHQSGAIPALALLFAIPNGGRRDPITGARLKAEGVKPGVPDVCLPVRRGRYASLWIEMKAQRPDGAAVSAEQRQWLQALRDEGHAAAVCYGYDEAKEKILSYLRMEAS